REHYRVLPAVGGYAVQNRYVGDWLLWGGWDMNRGHGEPAAYALRYADGAPAQPLAPGHAIERIETPGEHALLVGHARADLHLTGVRLHGGRAEIAGEHVQAGARQGETRTHGFF